MADTPKDQDEAKLERLAKRLLSLPPEPREKAAERGKRQTREGGEPKSNPKQRGR